MTVEIAVDLVSIHTIALIVNAVMLVAAMQQHQMKVNTFCKEMFGLTFLIYEPKWLFPGELGNHWSIYAHLVKV